VVIVPFHHTGWLWPELSASALCTSSMTFIPYWRQSARNASKTCSVVLPTSSGLAYVLTPDGAVACPARHSSSSWVEIGTRTMLMPRSAMDFVTSVRLADQRPWKTRSDRR
jgi:hypothetical protein